MTTKTQKPPQTDENGSRAHAESEGVGTGSLTQRLQRIREHVTYIQKAPTPGAPWASAVAHPHLIGKVRPFFVREGIMWHPVEVEVIDTWRGIVPTRTGERHVTKATVRTTFRFRRIDDTNDVLIVPVVTDAVDDADKGCLKALTAADKKVILMVLNLEQGDDPDFDRASYAMGTDEEQGQRILRLRELIDKHPDYKDAPEAYIQGWLVAYARAKGRHKAPTIYHLTTEQLDSWIAKVESELAGTK